MKLQIRLSKLNKNQSEYKDGFIGFCNIIKEILNIKTVDYDESTVVIFAECDSFEDFSFVELIERLKSLKQIMTEIEIKIHIMFELEYILGQESTLETVSKDGFITKKFQQNQFGKYFLASAITYNPDKIVLLIDNVIRKHKKLIQNHNS